MSAPCPGSNSVQAITPELLRSKYTIDLNAGRFFWKAPSYNHARLLGKEAGCAHRQECGKYYWIMKIGVKPYKRSHLIFLLINGRLPSPCADHIDGNSLNDRPENVREATIIENAWNHKTRARSIQLPMGVRLMGGRFQSRIGFNGKQIHLGSFGTIEQAHEVYLKKRKELFGEFA